MGFVKVIKNKSYYRRFQVKFRRRRENKTDYQQRRKLIQQDKRKYETPKYRFVVRITNSDIICQIFSSDINHDDCLASAYSHELRNYGLTVGLTNYAAAYATGLLLARRVNAKFGLDYEGQTEVDGDIFIVEQEDQEKAPFRALLDVGLARTTTGARVFGALKGAADGGLEIPHSDRRFPGSSREVDDDGAKEWNFDPETHKKYIFGGHVAEYMTTLQEDNAEKYKKQFSQYIALGLNADNLEAKYTAVHEAIRADPTKARNPLAIGNGAKARKSAKGEVKNVSYKKQRLVLQQRKARQLQKMKNLGAIQA
jgi:large subunit ribosomal protein L5e